MTHCSLCAVSNALTDMHMAESIHEAKVKVKEEQERFFAISFNFRSSRTKFARVRPRPHRS